MAGSAAVHALAAGLVVAAVAFTTIVARLAGWACTSGEEARGSLEADLCEGYVGSPGFSWWLAVLWPAIAFAVSQLMPPFRRRPVLVAGCLSVLGVAFWLATAALVIDV